MYHFIVSKNQEIHNRVKQILLAGYTDAKLEIVQESATIMIVQVHRDSEYSVSRLVHNAIDGCVVTPLDNGQVDCLIDQIHVIKVHATLYFDLEAHLITQSVCLEPMEFMVP